MAKKTIKKPWGKEEIVLREGYAQLKRLVIKKGESLSLQYHHEKNEFSVIIKGTVEVYVGLGCSKSISAYNPVVYYPGESFYVPCGMIHKISALEDAVILELCAGSDKDIVRLEDKYGRARQ